MARMAGMGWSRLGVRRSHGRPVPEHSPARTWTEASPFRGRMNAPRKKDVRQTLAEAPRKISTLEKLWRERPTEKVRPKKSGGSIPQKKYAQRSLARAPRKKSTLGKIRRERSAEKARSKKSGGSAPQEKHVQNPLIGRPLRDNPYVKTYFRGGPGHWHTCCLARPLVRTERLRARGKVRTDS
jgi:hypothetical protein